MNFNVTPDTIIRIGYDMWQKIQDYTDSAYYNLRSRHYADRQMANRQFAIAEAHKKDFDDFYDMLKKPMGLADRVGALWSFFF